MRKRVYFTLFVMIHHLNRYVHVMEVEGGGRDYLKKWSLCHTQHKYNVLYNGVQKIIKVFETM